MKRTFLIALLGAIPIEAVNLWLVMRFPFEAGGLPPGTSRWMEFVYAQALLLHFPGFWLFTWADNNHHYSLRSVALILPGYLDTVLLLFVAGFVYRKFRAFRQRALNPG